MDIEKHPERLEKQCNIGKEYIKEALSAFPDMDGQVTIQISSGGVSGYQLLVNKAKKKDKKERLLNQN